MVKQSFAFIIAVAGFSLAASASASASSLMVAASATADNGASVAQVAAARPVVDKIFPEGTYRKMMGESMSGMMDAMLGSAMAMPVADIARMSGLPMDQVSQMDKASLEEAMAIVDPYFRQRTRSGMDAMMGAMAELMNGYEPRVRDALTRAYARKFSITQLGELKAFFNTPTGSAYAAESMMIFMDKEIISEMQALMPDMMKQMPDMVAKAERATAALPAARKISDLSKQDRTRLAKILGVKEKDLQDRASGHDDSGHDDEGADDAVGVVDAAAGEGTE
ncbi:MAG: DUF2059 domain-containing protein [Sphingobium sp.]|nr:DUF2059 domain-containing protein [Sphingobium sp.]